MSLNPSIFENVDDLILCSIKSLREVNHKRLDETSIGDFLSSKTDIRDEDILSRIDSLLKSNKILNKPSNGKNSYFLNKKLDNLNDDNDNDKKNINDENNDNDDSSCDLNSGFNRNNLLEPFEKVLEDLDAMKVEFDNFKTSIINQVHSIKKTIEENQNQNHNTSISPYVKSLIEQIDFLKEENKSKSLLIQSLIENQCRSSSNDFITPKKVCKHPKNVEISNFKSVESPNSFAVLGNFPEECNSTAALNNKNKESLDSITNPSGNQKKDDSTRLRNSPVHNQPKKTKEKKSQSERPVTVILGDSMVKGLKGWELSDQSNHVVVKSFRGAKDYQMKWYIKPTIEQNPQNIILHCGTNDIDEKSKAADIANGILHLGNTIINESDSNLIISGIIPRKSDSDGKIKKINKLLEKKCNERNIGFVSHDNIVPKYHYTYSGLHLNDAGDSILAENFIYLLDSLNSER